MAGQSPQLPDRGTRVAQGPGGQDPVADPSLNGWAHFAFGILTDFLQGSFRGYDPAVHKYFRKYIHPTSYGLDLDITDGMIHGAQVPVAARVAVAREPRPARPDDPLDVQRTPVAPVGGGGAGGGPPSIPENIAWFQWTVLGDGGYHDRQILSRAESMRAAVQFELPHTGAYSVNLQVIFTDGRYGQQTASFSLRDFVIISLGDSTASGEGNPDSNGIVGSGNWKCDAAVLSESQGYTPDMEIQPSWMEEKAHRSLINGPAMAAQFFQHTYGRTLDAGAQRVVIDKITFASFARSGAKVIDGLLNSQTQPPNKDFIQTGQVEEASRTVNGRQINALLINIGGNDIGFSGVLTDLLESDNVFTANNDNDPAAVKARIDALLVQLDGNYDLLKAAVDENLHPRDVYITGYPTALFDATRPDGTIGFHACGVFQHGGDLDISQSDYNLIKEKGAALNFLIQRKARQFGWHFVDVEPHFVGRGYCDDNTLWVGASESCRRQGDFQGTMHPNWYGHRRWARAFVEQLQAHTILPLRPGLPQPGPLGPGSGMEQDR
jgi:hypothetical protein